MFFFSPHSALFNLALKQNKEGKDLIATERHLENVIREISHNPPRYWLQHTQQELPT